MQFQAFVANRQGARGLGVQGAQGMGAQSMGAQSMGAQGLCGQGAQGLVAQGMGAQGTVAQGFGACRLSYMGPQGVVLRVWVLRVLLLRVLCLQAVIDEIINTEHVPVRVHGPIGGESILSQSYDHLLFVAGGVAVSLASIVVPESMPEILSACSICSIIQRPCSSRSVNASSVVPESDGRPFCSSVL